MITCRSCNSKLSFPFLSLGNSPISNAYLSKDDLVRMEPYYPLDVYVCPECFLVQIPEYGRADEIFSQDYAYFSSYSKTWLDHCQNYVEMMVKKFGYNSSSFVIEIASNDGYLLQYFLEKGIPVLGVEPSGSVAEAAKQKGISTDVTFFTQEYAENLQKEGKLPDLIIGNNVLAHVPNINDFVAGLKIALSENGIITMEFPHVLRLLEKKQFDTIYHEHYSYYSLGPVIELFKRHGLIIFDVEELKTHGGSIRIYASHSGCLHKVSENVTKIIEIEKKAGIYSLDTYNSFATQVYKIKRDLLSLLFEIKNNGNKIVGYGAPAKGNTLLNYCGIRSDLLDYTVDISPHKQGKFLPGTHLPIYSPDKIRMDRPDFILILPWNIKDEIICQCSYIREWGGRFIVPIPEPEVIDEF